MRDKQKRTEETLEEACQQMSQGKLIQPRRLLESNLKSDPSHIPTRIALVQLAIRENRPEQAIREAKRAISIALLRCREIGIGSGEYSSHPTGVLLLRALHAAGQAYHVAGDLPEATNAFAVILNENPLDELGACQYLIQIFFQQGRLEGIVGLYRLGYTHGFNLLDVVLASLNEGDLTLALEVLIDALESAHRVRSVLEFFSLSDEVEDPLTLDYLNRRGPAWGETIGALAAVRTMLAHPVLARTLELLDELEQTRSQHPEVELDEGRAEMFANLRSDKVSQAVLATLESS